MDNHTTQANSQTPRSLEDSNYDHFIQPSDALGIALGAV